MSMIAGIAGAADAKKPATAGKPNILIFISALGQPKP